MSKFSILWYRTVPLDFGCIIYICIIGIITADKVMKCTNGKDKFCLCFWRVFWCSNKETKAMFNYAKYALDCISCLCMSQIE